MNSSNQNPKSNLNPTINNDSDKKLFLNMTQMQLGIVVGVILLIIIIIIVVVVVLSKKKKQPVSTTIPSVEKPTNTNNNNNNNNIEEEEDNSNNNILPDDGKEVYSVDYNVFNYKEAPFVCKALGGELATYEQLVNSAKNGANWCNMGWFKQDYIKGKRGEYNAGYPVQKDYYEKLQTLPLKEGEKQICGSSWDGKDGNNYSIQNLSNLSHTSRRGVNCYGTKTKLDVAINELSKNPSPSELHPVTNKTKDRINQLLTDTKKYKKRLAFNQNKWSKYD